MDKQNKFINFIDSFKSSDNSALVESIKHGFIACMESGTNKVMNHMEYMNKIRDEKKYPDSKLEYIIHDCRDVINAWNNDGNSHHPNEGYYEDEIHYCSMELARRAKLRDKRELPLS